MTPVIDGRQRKAFTVDRDPDADREFQLEEINE